MYEGWRDDFRNNTRGMKMNANKEDFTKDPAAIAAAEAIDISDECLAAAFALAVTFEGLLRDVDTPSEKRSI